MGGSRHCQASTWTRKSDQAHVGRQRSAIRSYGCKLQLTLTQFPLIGATAGFNRLASATKSNQSYLGELRGPLHPLSFPFHLSQFESSPHHGVRWSVFQQLAEAEGMPKLFVLTDDSLPLVCYACLPAVGEMHTTTLAVKQVSVPVSSLLASCLKDFRGLGLFGFMWCVGCCLCHARGVSCMYAVAVGGLWSVVLCSGITVGSGRACVIEPLGLSLGTAHPSRAL